MSSNYPPGVTGREPQIAGDPREAELENIENTVVQRVKGFDFSADDDALSAIAELILDERDKAERRGWTAGYNERKYESPSHGPIINWDKLPAKMRLDLKEKWEDHDEDWCRRNVLDMSDLDLFTEWCEYEGFIGWSRTLMMLMDGIRKARE